LAQAKRPRASWYLHNQRFRGIIVMRREQPRIRPHSVKRTAKKGTISGGRIMDLLSPDDIGSIMSSPFVVLYWPLLAGALLLLVFLMRGYYRATIPIAAIALLIQAWHSGVFGAK
jgi:hypothetical protein